MRDYECERDEWQYAVGGFVLACGDIELITFRLCYSLNIDPPQKAGKRFENIIKTLQGKGATENIVPLERAKKLFLQRNIVAHSPLQLRYYEDNKSCHGFDYAIVGHKGVEYIDLQAIKELCAEAEDIVAELTVAFQIPYYSRGYERS